MPVPIRPLLLGHRGARAVRSIPENTLESFDRALADGCDGFEFDVRLTADEEAVVCHDARISGYEVSRTPAKQLDRLPRLRDVLQRYRSSFLDIELKVKGLEKITLDLFLRHKPLRGFVVSSFQPGTLKSVRALDASILLGLICEFENQLRLWSELPVQYVIAHQALVDAELVRKIKGAGKKIIVWTVNVPEDMRRFADLGVDGIISDDTSLLCRTIGAQQSKETET
ncbi:MAG TPA: glycerophosphodiester phosphodiesterase [Nitrospiraceae bacterium]|nr:glycerophosphodiester phosphodiesterase [Nitrospiraceae bacterium]